MENRNLVYHTLITLLNIDAFHFLQNLFHLDTVPSTFSSI